jgi:hypothetical protein
MCKADKEAEDDACSSSNRAWQRDLLTTTLSVDTRSTCSQERVTDPVNDADVPDEETETRQDNDDDSDSLADIRDQFMNDIEYPLSPF